ncbi:unnamed protein product [Fusarium graminearum]|uniref:Chromosome 3, complete genome n=2 Tax=Gibberella zeae TaxID=5518 RepID=I1RPU6_GIBZE|nr:hypothetical protein FGSG_06076 [Fusarium graminearum PH-1]KAI6751716.1 hypothetical protein HG531_006412 [Fusarium graminearum]ESU12123.1 hypothetical protein FGSG_06076 [Fusarium graminearum PH-1]PCD19334.1 hypothetical protein FGRA07_06139 [Fusarium graminearum]CAF3486438.1 unnamed protein product [Fusarium graminearum]CAG1961022.1 unnamed protein product [Fusarium graminearum]|eukprot:XP_011324699.1 hypothetical protein FGSG_06076 [Fusarium graminearum PH-1]
MAVYKLKALASILALCATLATATGTQGESVPCMSAHTETETPYTHEYGAGISDGTVIHSMTVCSVVHETKCVDTTSAEGESMQPPPAATDVPSGPPGEQPSVPAGGEQTTYHGQSVSSGTEDVPTSSVPIASVTVSSVAPGASETNYAPPAGVSDSAASAEHGSVPGANPSVINPSGVIPSEGGEVVPVSSLISTTDVSGNPTILTTLYSEPSAAVSDTATATVVTGSETVYDTVVSGTATGTDAEETDGVTPTGTPTVTASAAAKQLIPGAILGLVGIVFAAIF